MLPEGSTFEIVEALNLNFDEFKSSNLSSSAFFSSAILCIKKSLSSSSCISKLLYSFKFCLGFAFGVFFLFSLATV